ncbi:uncharacterized protein LOC130899972 [Diorhabda carinulata]|uniref:uncharacterized protein LOC130899972 n=1 Tax=Diorhabda carinulata TaxID=1163345 RepID=UPI0025A12EE3|nr:uncharacterized protein LOC130899972 [Diorhabda carinulata]
MKGLLIIFLAYVVFVSAANKNNKKDVNKRSYLFPSDDLVQGIDYQAPYSTYSSAISAPGSIISSAPLSSGYLTPISTSRSAYVSPISTADSVSFSNAGLTSYPAIDTSVYSPSISSVGSSYYPTVDSGLYQSAPVSSVRLQSYTAAESPSVSYVQPQYNVINKKVPVYVSKPVPYEVTKTVKVPTPYKVTVPKPYAVPVKVNVPVEIPKPYEVKIEHKVPVPVAERVPIEIPRPYPVYKTKKVPVEIEKPVYVKEKIEVRYPVPKPYPVEVPSAVRVKVPQRILIKEPQFVSSVGTYDNAFSVPNFVYGKSVDNAYIPTSYGKTILSSSSAAKSLDDSISTSVQESAAIGQTLTQLSEQSLISGQTGYDQAVQGFGGQSFGIDQGFQTGFGGNYFPGLQQTSDFSVDGLQSYEDYRKTHLSNGVINDEKESVSVEAKSGDLDKSNVEGGNDAVESTENSTPTPVSATESETESSEGFNSDESTVPSQTTDIL